MLHRYLKVVPVCTHCEAPLGEIRADDFPPYITIVVVGHVVVPLLVLSEKYLAPPQWMHFTVWPLLAAGLMALVLPRAKGLCVGFMWHLGLEQIRFNRGHILLRQSS